MVKTKKIPIGGVLNTECGQELWQIACQWVWNLRLSLGETIKGAS
jgi:hypothetical protein